MRRKENAIFLTPHSKKRRNVNNSSLLSTYRLSILLFCFVVCFIFIIDLHFAYRKREERDTGVYGKRSERLRARRKARLQNAEHVKALKLSETDKSISQEKKTITRKPKTGKPFFKKQYKDNNIDHGIPLVMLEDDTYSKRSGTNVKIEI